MLVFHNTFLGWIAPPHSLQPVPSWKHEVPLWIDSVDVAWVDRDEEAPPPDTHRDLDLQSLAWCDYDENLKTAVNDWLVADTKGPMREVIALRCGTLPTPRSSPALDPPRAIGPFRVRYNAVQEWSRDPASLSGVYPATSKRRYQTLESANSAAVEAVNRVLSREIEEEHEELLLDELDEIFPVGGDVPQAVQWDRAEDPDGTVRVRALYVNRNENIKVTAWVEKE